LAGRSGELKRDRPIVAVCRAGSRSAQRGPKLFCMPNPPPSRNEALSEFVKWAQVFAGSHVNQIHRRAVPVSE
jgi:hypothetical protein